MRNEGKGKNTRRNAVKKGEQAEKKGMKSKEDENGRAQGSKNMKLDTGKSVKRAGLGGR